MRQVCDKASINIKLPMDHIQFLQHILIPRKRNGDFNTGDSDNFLTLAISPDKHGLRDPISYVV